MPKQVGNCLIRTKNNAKVLISYRTQTLVWLHDPVPNSKKSAVAITALSGVEASYQLSKSE